MIGSSKIKGLGFQGGCKKERLRVEKCDRVKQNQRFRVPRGCKKRRLRVEKCDRVKKNQRFRVLRGC